MMHCQMTVVLEQVQLRASLAIVDWVLMLLLLPMMMRMRTEQTKKRIPKMMQLFAVASCAWWRPCCSC